jgi:hypothetical protein
MGLYNRYVRMIQSLQTRNESGRRAHHINMGSPFIDRLAEEAGYSTITLGSLPHMIKSHGEDLHSQAEQKRSLLEKAQARRAELLELKASLETELAALRGGQKLMMWRRSSGDTWPSSCSSERFRLNSYRKTRLRRKKSQRPSLLIEMSGARAFVGGSAVSLPRSSKLPAR